MGVAFGGEVQHPVGGVQVRVASSAVGEASDLDGAEHGGQGPFVAGLDGPSRCPLGVGDIEAGFALGAQVQVVLEQPAEQFAAVYLESALQLAMVEPARLAAFQPGDDRLELVTRHREGGRVRLGGVRRHRCPRRRDRRTAMPASAARSSSAFVSW